MRFYAFHLMPWPYLPADFGATHDTAWVICENDLYDPKRGQEVYNVWQGQNTNATVNNIPHGGGTVYVTLWSYIDGAWQAADYQFHEAP